MWTIFKISKKNLDKKSGKKIISKMIPTAPFKPVGVTMSQCPIRILDCRLNSRSPLFHWSLTHTGVIDAVGIIFDIEIF